MIAGWVIGCSSPSDDFFSSSFNRHELGAHPDLYTVGIGVYLAGCKAHLLLRHTLANKYINVNHINVEATANIEEHKKVYILLLPFLD
jgi:hypothetical protein